MSTAILGASGSGKSAVASRLRSLLPSFVVLDWDGLMEPAGELAGRSIPTSPETWPAYHRLVYALGEQVGWHRLVLLTVCEPHELVGWPIKRWIVLDCSDAQRQVRLVGRLDRDGIAEAIDDGRRYRNLGVPMVDSTDRSIDDVARELSKRVQSLRQTRRVRLSSGGR